MSNELDTTMRRLKRADIKEIGYENEIEKPMPRLNRPSHLVVAGIEPRFRKWSQNGTTVTNGNVTLEVGSRVKGYEAGGENRWYVLGAENEKLLITSNYEKVEVKLSGRDGYLNGIEILNNAAKEFYDDGIFADTVRSINVDDINRVTGYNPEISACSGASNIFRYGTEITYYWNGTGKPSYSYYTYRNFSPYENYLKDRHNSGFFYPTPSGFLCSNPPTVAIKKSQKKIITLKNIAYDYIFDSDSDSGSLIYSHEAYWLGSQLVFGNTAHGFVYFGLFYVIRNALKYCSMFKSNGDETCTSMGLRPVVSLKSEVTVDSDGNITI